MTAPATTGGRRRPMTYCASCQLNRPHNGRGLCASCYTWHRRNGTLADYGYPQAARYADYTWLRVKRGLSVAGAAASIKVSERTGWRYERQLRAAQQARTRRGNP